ncbi:pleckstrin homology domain-containing family M member 2-like [Asterias rubens]|uniref:pleckstrin homology domain-containing family M member 2-like n=1 Tax=Asterias rubens TaxID=7604 RepID=UPI0014558966|nr:pleckstrin homology domain-containing family M member 2-like [Asterias rubens]
MSSKRGHFKDRILEGIAKAIKEVQSFSYGLDGEVLKVTNDDRPLQKLVERLDHAFLHGLKNVTCGYWGVTKLFAHRGIINEITHLDRLTTDLGRSRAWLYKSLNETAMESYLRCFLENPITMRKYYVENGMLRDKQRLIILQTLISGLDFVTFDLELNIAYFDLVSYIPRSASISEHEDNTPTNDNVPTTPSTPATNPDNDGNSSIASSDAFSPMDESPQAGSKIPDLLLKDKMKRIEKRHSLPQHYSEIDFSDLSLAGTTDQKDGRDGGVYQRSYSVGKIGESKPVRPASLGVASRYEVKFLGEDSSPRGSIKSLEDDQRDGDLEVIRVKTKKVKKGQKKKKKTDRSSLDGDSQSITSSTACDENETDSQDQLLTMSCSVSSFQSSDGTLLNQPSNPEEINADSSTKNIIQNTVMENTECLSNLKHTPGSDEKTERLQKMDDQEEFQRHLTEENLTEESQISFDLQPTCDSNINDSANLATDLSKIELPQIIHQRLTSKSSLDFDETVQLTLSSPKPIKVFRNPSKLLEAPQPTESIEEEHSNLNQSDVLDVSLSQSVLSDEVPSFASLFSKTTSQTPWVSDDHPRSSAESSMLSDISANHSEEGSIETSGCKEREMRTSSDTSSFKEEYSDEQSEDVTKGTVTKAISMEADFHEAEIIVDNNVKLYLMLEIFKNEHEQLKKLIRMSTGHTEADLQPAFILLTDYTLYILRRGEKQGHFSTQHRLPYTTLDYISVGLHYQTIQIVCTNRRRQYWLTTGDESLTRFFLSSLRRVMDDTKRSTEPISILTDATAQLITLKKWAAQECKTEIHDIKLHLYSLIHWEDLADLSMTPDLQLYEPQVSRKGSLKYKVVGSFLVGRSHWKSGWFVLRNEMFCRYSQKEDRQPDLSIQLRAPHFGGCRRVRNGDRPHSFELILSDGASLELSCDTEEEVSDWLQTICQVVAQGQIAATTPTHAPSPCQPCCVVTTSHKLLICHEDCQTNFYRLLASVDVHDVTQLTTDHEDGAYIIVEFLSEHPQNPWVFYFNSVNEKVKFVTSLTAVWKQIMQVDLPIIPISDSRVQKRCQECSALIQSSWQRSDSLMRGRVGGNIW